MFSNFIFKDVWDIQGDIQVILYNLQVCIYQMYIIIKDKYF